MRMLYELGRVVAFCAGQAFCGERAFGIGNVPTRGPVLLAANHQSFLDPMLLAYPLPRECHFMARDTLFDTPVFGTLIRGLNAFPIRRGTADMAGIKDALRRLKSGALVVTFPEGTRSVDGRVAPFQAGVLTLARRTGSPVVPAAIEGAIDAWPRGGVPRPARVMVQYGRPLPKAMVDDEDHEVVAAELTARVRELHNRLRQRAGRTVFRYGKPA